MAEGRGMQGFHPCPVSLCVSLLYMVERWKTSCNRDGCPWRGNMASPCVDQDSLHGPCRHAQQSLAEESWMQHPVLISFIFFLYNRFLFIVFNQFSSIFSRKFTLELIVFKQPYSRVNLWNRPNQDRTII